MIDRDYLLSKGKASFAIVRLGLQSRQIEHNCWFGIAKQANYPSRKRVRGHGGVCMVATPRGIWLVETGQTGQSGIFVARAVVCPTGSSVLPVCIFNPRKDIMKLNNVRIENCADGAFG